MQYLTYVFCLSLQSILTKFLDTVLWEYSHLLNIRVSLKFFGLHVFCGVLYSENNICEISENQFYSREIRSDLRSKMENLHRLSKKYAIFHLCFLSIALVDFDEIVGESTLGTLPSAEHTRYSKNLPLTCVLWSHIFRN